MIIKIRMHWTILSCLLLAMSLHSAEAQPDPDVCIPGPGDTKGQPLPILPEQFKLRVDAYIANRDYTTVNIEYYDDVNNKGAFEIYHVGNVTGRMTNERIFYDYDDEQYYIVYPNDTCVTRKLTNHSFSVFGYHTEGGRGHINSAKDVFQFGEEYNETYMGQTTVDYMTADWWSACTYMESVNYTYKLDVYFSADNSTQQTVPIRMVINGTAPLHWNETDQPGRRQFYHIYTFRDVQIGPQPKDVFWPPIGVVCPGRVNKKDLPQVPEHFGISVEVVIPENRTVYYTKEYYDTSKKLVAYEFLPRADEHWRHPQTFRIVHDYNTGISYMINAPGMCLIHPIPTWVWDAYSPDGQHVVMRSSVNFLALHAEDVEWVYEGQTLHRDVTLNVWQTKRSQWKPHQYLRNDTITANSTWEYSFPVDGWTVNGHQMGRHNIYLPSRLEIHWVAYDNKQKQIAVGSEIHNFFQPTGWVAGIDPFDVSDCYTKMNESLQLAFNLEGKDTYTKYVVNNTAHFYDGATNSIASAMDISSTRITHLRVVNGFHNLSTVFFTLLDRPQIEGDAINQTDPGPGLKTAYAQLQILINTEEGDTLTLEFIYHDKIQKVNAATNTLREETQPLIQTEQTGLASGTVAGIAIGTFVLGAAIALVCAFIVYKKQNTAVPYEVQE